MNTKGQIKICYVDCFSGVSGDMFLGALVDAGLPLDFLQSELAGLQLDNFQILATKLTESSIEATRLEIETDESDVSRTWKTIRLLIEQSPLQDTVKEKSLAVFICLAEAEANVHGCTPEDVHFHELGGLDAIIDIVGSAIGLAYLEIDHLVTAPLPLSRGWVTCEHGTLPLPAPAVCEILKDVPVAGTDIDMELVTPTGAALVKTLSRDFGNLPTMIINRTGYGAGSHKLPGNKPNLLRLVIGHARSVEECQEVEVIETNLDDWSPEGFPHLCNHLFSHGALDVSLVPIQMKKGRPGFLLRVIADPAHSLKIKERILAETTAIGLRFRMEKRITLPRQTGTVKTVWGPVKVKKVETPAGPAIYPEYEDCQQLAIEHDITLKEVYAEVNRCSPEEFHKTEDKG
jgi:uncharacterized protein (TIGR00299 family) protein